MPEKIFGNLNENHFGQLRLSKKENRICDFS